MRKYVPLSLALFLTMLSSCNFPEPEASTLSAKEIQTFAAQTAAILLTQEAGGQNPIPAGQDQTQATPQPAVPTDTPQPTATFTPIATITLTHTPSRTPIPCNWAYYMADVTYPDGAVVPPSWTIEKTWRLKNFGSCTWTSGYQLIFESGDRMDAPDWVQLTTDAIPPGSTVDVTVTLHTPAADGTYQGFFKLRSSEGQVFGIGAGAASAFWVKVKVQRTVDLMASFNNVHHCGNYYSTTFLVGDTGNVGLESAQVRLINRATSDQIGPTFTSDSPWLPTAAACLPGADGPIGPGSTWFLAVNFFPPMVPTPSGLEVRAFIKACTGEGLSGDCVEKQVDFTYP